MAAILLRHAEMRQRLRAGPDRRRAGQEFRRLVRLAFLPQQDEQPAAAEAFSLIGKLT